jgi:hypothetical protein
VTHSDPTGKLWGWLNKAATFVGNAVVNTVKEAVEHPLDFAVNVFVTAGITALVAGACAVTVGVGCVIAGGIVGGLAGGLAGAQQRASREGRPATWDELGQSAAIGAATHAATRLTGSLAGKAAGRIRGGGSGEGPAGSSAKPTLRAETPIQRRQLEAAAAARDAEMEGYVGKTYSETPATFTAGINPKTGEIAVGWSDGAGKCAECFVAEKLGLQMDEVLYTYAYGFRQTYLPSKGLNPGPKAVVGIRDKVEVPVCKSCQQKSSPSQYPADAKYEPGGAWDNSSHYVTPDGRFCSTHGGPCAV